MLSYRVHVIFVGLQELLLLSLKLFRWRIVSLLMIHQALIEIYNGATVATQGLVFDSKCCAAFPLRAVCGLVFSILFMFEILCYLRFLTMVIIAKLRPWWKYILKWSIIELWMHEIQTRARPMWVDLTFIEVLAIENWVFIFRWACCLI